MPIKHYILSAIALIPLSLSAAEKHVHGEAELFIAQQDGKLLIELASPADNLIGFEHAPKSAKQKHLLHETLEKLTSHLSIVDASAGSCQQTEHTTTNPFDEHKAHHDHDEHAHEEHHHHEEDTHKEHHDHEEHAHEEHHHDHEEEGHADFHLSYTLHCQNLNALNTIKVTAFEHFSGFEKITVKWVAGDKQGSNIATKATPVVGIK